MMPAPDWRERQLRKPAYQADITQGVTGWVIPIIIVLILLAVFS